MICPFCKSEIPDDAKKCKYCAEWVDLESKPNNQHPQGCFSFLWDTFVNLLWFAFIVGIITLAILLYMQTQGQISLG